jgi:hypothetical protein
MGKEKGTIWNPQDKKKGGGGKKGPPTGDEEAGPRCWPESSLSCLACSAAPVRWRGVAHRVGKKQAAAAAKHEAKVAELKDKGCTSWAPVPARWNA